MDVSVQAQRRADRIGRGAHQGECGPGGPYGALEPNQRYNAATRFISVKRIPPPSRFS